MPWKDYERLLSKVANYYYHQEKSQQEIADILGLSRSKVCRMLAEAKNLGIVQIIVKYPLSTCNELETEFERLFKLREAIIINDYEDENLLNLLGQAGANFIDRIVSSNDVIGISWGETLLNVVNQMDPISATGVKVVQMVGSLNNSGQNVQAVELARRLGKLLGCEPNLLHCPAVVTSPQVRRGLLDDENIRKVVDMWRKLTIAIVGIGTISIQSELFKNHHLNSNWRELLLKDGAVGDVCMRFFDQKGNNCCEKLNELIMGITIEEIKNVRTVVCIAGGVAKANAILGALNSGIPDVLITDRTTAIKVLELNEKGGGSG